MVSMADCQDRVLSTCSGSSSPLALSTSGSVPYAAFPDVGVPSRPESASGITSRPRSRSSSSSGLNSMVRLPHDPVGPGAPLSSPTGSRPGSTGSQQRPRPAGLERLQDEATPGSQGTGISAPSTTPIVKKVSSASLSRLPPENPAASSAQGQAQQATSTSSPSSATAKPGASMRDRFNKSLTVSTDAAKTVAAEPIFRLLQDHEKISDLYTFAEKIYCGGAKGKVLTATCKADGKEVIVKVRTKQGRHGEHAWRTIMTQLHSIQGHRHVLEITEILEDSLCFYIVMPKCNGGELFEFLVTETEVPEAECKRIIREILVAVGHLHAAGLVHRDVKPENIMFNMDIPAKTPKTVKLIDFDTCLEFTPNSPKSSKFVGTPGYIAPEALLGEITPQSDLWSIGVILYILMTGETPWSSLEFSLEDGTVGSPSATRMYNALKEEVLEWDKEPWPDFPLAKDLCQRLLAFNTEERALSFTEALEHPWLRE